MRRLALVLLATLAAAPAARGDTFAPPPGKVYTGVSGGVSTQPYSGEVGKDIAVMGVFVQWDGGFNLRMELYNQGGAPGGPFRLTHHPRSRKAIRAELRKLRHRGRP